MEYAIVPKKYNPANNYTGQAIQSTCGPTIRQRAKLRLCNHRYSSITTAKSIIRHLFNFLPIPGPRSSKLRNASPGPRPGHRRWPPGGRASPARPKATATAERLPTKKTHNDCGVPGLLLALFQIPRTQIVQALLPARPKPNPKVNADSTSWLQQLSCFPGRSAVAGLRIDSIDGLASCIVAAAASIITAAPGSSGYKLHNHALLVVSLGAR